MHFTVAAALLASASTVVASDSCSQDGWNNYYCNEIDHITYKDLGSSGSYSRVSSMDTVSGTCSFDRSPYSGSLAPLDEELSIHIRGPIHLKGFAAYTLGTFSKKRSNIVATPHERRMKSRAEKEKREDWVTATIDGQVVSWINDYNPGAQPTETAHLDPGFNNIMPVAHFDTNAATGGDSTVEDSDESGAESGNESGSSSSSSTSSSTTTSSVPSSTSSNEPDSSSNSGSGYSRTGYYRAENGTADGVTFLGNYGGIGSGVWTSTFGNTLSYLSADGTTGAESSTVLSNIQVDTNKEYSIWSDQDCSDGNCGFYRDGSVAYHGFGGADKVFIFEFSMPLDESCSEEDFNCDMPAIWMLNSLIPRTAQYSECSCWTTGCGEFDIYEVLYPHDLRAKTTFHANTPGGSSDYFPRPTTGYVQVAVVLDSASNEVVVKILDGFGFPTTLDRKDVESMLAGAGNDSESSSIFNITP